MYQTTSDREKINIFSSERPLKTMHSPGVNQDFRKYALLLQKVRISRNPRQNADFPKSEGFALIRNTLDGNYPMGMPGNDH